MADITDINASQTIKIVGSESDGTEQTPVQSDERGRLRGVISFEDTGQLDAFHRLRASFTTTLFDAQFHFDKRLAIWSELVEGSATSNFDTNLHSVRMNLGTTSGNKVTRQTYRRFKCDPGKSTSFIGTSTLGQPKSNTRKRFGLFDTNNGLFFEVNSTTPRVVIRSSVTGSVVDTAIDQANWNIDKFDGSGPTGLTLNFDNTQIFVIDFQWLGSGRVRFGFYINGEIRYCHEAPHYNSAIGPYMQTASLPIRIEAENTGTSASDTVVYQTCQTLIRESLQEPEGIIRSINSGTSGRTVGVSVETPIISIRVNPLNFNQILDLIDASLYVTGNSDIIYKLHIGGTLTGAVWNSAGDFTQFDTAATSITTSGIIVETAYIRSSTSSPLLSKPEILSFLNILIGAGLDNEPRIVTITAQSLSGNSQVYGVVSFREVS